MSFDLDALEREDAKEVFTATVGGKDVRFADPSDLDWQDVASINAADPEQFLSSVVHEDDSEHFFGESIPSWKLNKLLEAYLDHYGLAAPGETSASRGSSRATARQSKRTSRSGK